MTTKSPGADDLEFSLVGEGTVNPFDGYVSDQDKTTLAPQTLVQGSQNVVKTLAGTIAPRQGKKVYDPLDTSADGTKSSFDWYDSLGNQLAIRVLASGKFQLLSNALNGVDLVWYTLLSGLTKTRFIFDTWWDATNGKDVLIGVNGSASEYSWTGAFGFLASAAATAKSSLWQVRYPIAGTSTSGTYAVGDILTIGGGVGGTVVITSVTAGAPLGFRLLSLGSGYTAGNSIATTGGGGSGMTVDIVQVRDTYTITKTGTQTFAQLGFANDSQNITSNASPGAQGVNSNNNRIMVNGIEYSYFGGVGTTTLTGVGGYTANSDPSAVAANTFINQSVIEHTNFVSSTYTIDMVLSVNNQIINASYSSRVVYAANSTDFTLIGNGAALPGYHYILTLDENVAGLAVRMGNLQIGAGLSNWYEVTLTNAAISPSSGVVQNYKAINVLKKTAADLSAPLGQEFITNMGDDVVYVGQDHQIYIYGSFTDQFTNRFPSLSQAIRTELAALDLTGGQLRSSTDQLNLTVPLSGKVFVYNSRQNINATGSIVSERFWDSPSTLNISRIAVLNGKKYGYATDHPQLYQLSDTNQYHDDSSEGVATPYISIARFAYRNHGRRQGLLSADQSYTEGYMQKNTNLYGRIRYDYLGASGIDQFSVSTSDENATLFLPVEVRIVGTSPVGTREIGGAIPTFDYNSIPKFRTINGLTQPNCFEYQTEYYSVDADSKWELLCFGTNAQLSDQQAIDIKRT